MKAEHPAAPARRARVLLHCVGSAGDVLPFIAIGRHLIDLGVDVTLATSAYFAGLMLPSASCARAKANSGTRSPPSPQIGALLAS